MYGSTGSGVWARAEETNTSPACDRGENVTVLQSYLLLWFSGYRLVHEIVAELRSAERESRPCPTNYLVIASRVHAVEGVDALLLFHR